MSLNLHFLLQSINSSARTLKNKWATLLHEPVYGSTSQAISKVIQGIADLYREYYDYEGWDQMTIHPQLTQYQTLKLDWMGVSKDLEEKGATTPDEINLIKTFRARARKIHDELVIAITGDLDRELSDD